MFCKSEDCAPSHLYKQFYYGVTFVFKTISIGSNKQKACFEVWKFETDYRVYPPPRKSISGRIHVKVEV